MGCSQSDTRNQTATRREERMAKVTGTEDTSLYTDDTISTNHSAQQQATNTVLAEKALAKLNNDKEAARSKVSFLRQKPSPAAAPDLQVPSPNTMGPTLSPRDVETTLRTAANEDEVASRHIHSNNNSPPSAKTNNPLHPPARNKAVSIQVPQKKSEDNRSDVQSEMGEVELGSQVGRGSTPSHASYVEGNTHATAKRQHADGHRTLVDTSTDVDSADYIPTTFLPGGNRFRRIGDWIDGTRTYQVYVVIHSKAAPRSKPKKQSTTPRSFASSDHYHSSGFGTGQALDLSCGGRNTNTATDHSQLPAATGRAFTTVRTRQDFSYGSSCSEDDHVHNYSSLTSTTNPMVARTAPAATRQGDSHAIAAQLLKLQSHQQRLRGVDSINVASVDDEDDDFDPYAVHDDEDDLEIEDEFSQ